MRLSDIIARAGDYLLFGGAAVLSAAALFFVGYFFVYKKLMKGKRTLHGAGVLWAAVFGCYIIVVLCATLLDRGAMWGGRVIPLFYSYREAWRDFSAVAWRNLLLNVAMFVPFGFLLPLGVKRFRRFYRTYAAGLLFTIFIELTQLFLRRGVVEMDDILNNFLGAAVGYGCFAAVDALAGVLKRKAFGKAGGAEKKDGQGRANRRGAAVWLPQLPLFGAALGFCLLFAAYHGQELGNLSEECILAYDTALLKLTSSETYDESEGTLPVYRLERLTVPETEARAEALFALLGTELDRSRNDIYENTAVYYGKDNYSLWIEYVGGTYSISDFGAWEKEKEEDASESRLRERLEDYGVRLPDGAVFENLGQGQYTFLLEQVRSGEDLYDGALTCTYYKDDTIGRIQNRILTCRPYREFPVISEKEAWERLCAGKFAGGIHAGDRALEGQVGRAEIAYRADSKGFYQPVYVFDCVIDGREEKIVIPAVADKSGGGRLPSDAGTPGGEGEGSADPQTPGQESGGSADPGTPGGESGESADKPTAPQELVTVKTRRVTVHDPSVVYDGGTYYIFGSHMAWAKSSDLMSWEYFDTNINTEYGELFGREWESWCRSEGNELKGNLWAPDVIYNEKMEKYCLYMSVNGNDWNSAIVMLTADDIEGPYEYGGTVVYSGFDSGAKHPARLTDVYRVLGEDADLKRYQSTSDTKLNCIDPCVTYDEEGGLWMSYGSWFGGIYLLKLDGETGLRDYETVYETRVNESDAYYGYKIAGGCGVSGEASYIIHKGEYYYLFMSYGGLTATGGYQIRVFRSENINGPYADQAGNPAVYVRAQNNLFGRVGLRLMGSYDWTGNREIRVAQGHNSAVIAEDGRIFLVYHSRFAGGKNGISEAHEVRVQQLFVNEDGWLAAAPYEYAGERLNDRGYAKEELVGEYEFLLHEPAEYYRKYGQEYKGITEAVRIVLLEDGGVDGDLTGSWTFEQGTPRMSITLEGVTYRGVFLKMPSEELLEDGDTRRVVMTFTAVGDNTAVWGSK